MIGTITLNPSIDRNLVVRRLVKDDANRAERVLSTPGGKGVNVSKVIRELGGPTHAVAIAGGVTGRLFEALVRGLDIRLTVVRVDGLTRINTVLTDVHDRTQTRVSDIGPHVSGTELRRLRRALFSFKRRPFCWAFGGSLPQGMPAATYRDLIHELQSSGVPCVLDADGDALKEGIEAKPFLVKPNEFEVSRLLGRRIRGVRQAAEAARCLVDRRGVRIAVVSLAAKGAVFAGRSETFHVPVPDVRVRSKVGAGDSVIGGVLFGLFKKMSLREAARLGMAASLSAVIREAPRLCRRGDIPTLLRRLKPIDL